MLRAIIILCAVLLISTASSAEILDWQLMLKSLKEDGHPPVTHKELQEKIEREGRFVLVDVREKDEYANGHIPGAINIPRSVLEFIIKERIPNEHTEIIVYSNNERRAIMSTLIMKMMDYRHVYYLAGGYEEYKAPQYHGYVRTVAMNKAYFSTNP